MKNIAPILIFLSSSLLVTMMSCNKITFIQKSNENIKEVTLKDPFIISKFRFEEAKDSLELNLSLRSRRFSPIYIDSIFYVTHTKAYKEGSTDTTRITLASLGRTIELQPEPIEIIAVGKKQLKLAKYFPNDVDFIEFKIFYIKNRKEIDKYNEFHIKDEIVKGGYYNDIFLSGGDYIVFNVEVKGNKIVAYHW